MSFPSPTASTYKLTVTRISDQVVMLEENYATSSTVTPGYVRFGVVDGTNNDRGTIMVKHVLIRHLL